MTQDKTNNIIERHIDMSDIDHMEVIKGQIAEVLCIV